MQPDRSTPLRKLLDTLLAAGARTSLDTYVGRHRARGQSWRWIAADLERTTGVRVSWSTLRGWYTDPLADTAPAEAVA